jgi:SAM-dependent methyltransferase
MANEQMVEIWNGPASQSWVTAAERYDAMLATMLQLVLDTARLQAGERVLDVGAGAGALTRAAAAAVGAAGHITAVDISQPLLAHAAAQPAPAGAADIEWLLADAQTHELPDAAYDVVLSRFGVMFFEDPTAAFANLRSATAPGGRLAAVVWQAAPANEWVLLPMGAIIPHVGFPDLPPSGAPGPFAFGDGDALRTVLEGAGWREVTLQPVERTVVVPGDVDAVVEHYVNDTFGQMALAKATPAQRAAALTAMREAFAPHMSEDGAQLGAAVWVVTARA